MKYELRKRGHALLSASGAPKWMRCAGSVAMEYNEPDDGNTYSTEGDDAHQLASMSLLDAKHPSAFLGRKLDKGHVVDIDMVANVNTYVQAIYGELNLASGENNSFYVEQQLDYSHVVDLPEQWGTGDVVVLKPAEKELQVHDLKYGKGVPVRAEENEQLLLYLLGAIKKFGGDWLKFKLFVHQPRIHMEPDVWECDFDYVRKFTKRVQERAKHAIAALDERPEALIHHLTPGDKQCRAYFCKAKGKCPAYANRVGVDAYEAFDAINIEPEKTEEEVRARVMDGEPKQLAIWRAHIPFIQAFCKAVTERADAMVLSGVHVPGLKAVEGKRGDRYWSDLAEAEKRMRASKLKVDEIFVSKLISPAVAQKILKGDRAKVWDKLSELVKQDSGKPTVVPEDDKRPAISVKQAGEELVDETGSDLV